MPTSRSSMIGKKKRWGDESDDESDYESNKISTSAKRLRRFAPRFVRRLQTFVRRSPKSVKWSKIWGDHR